jgi:hypothetical protein
MKHRWILAAATSAVAVAVGACALKTEPAAAPQPVAAADAATDEASATPVADVPDRPASVIEAKADEIARAMCECLKNAKRFTFKTETSTDRRISTGGLVTLEANSDVAVRRPNALRVLRESTKGKRLFQYDGKTVTVLDVGRDLYAQADAPATIDDTLDAMEAKLGIVVPLSDLFCDDPYSTFSDYADGGEWMGVHPVRGKQCDLIVYSNDVVDWQVWVAQDGPRVPLKFAITYKTERGSPRFVAHLYDWNLEAAVPDSEFAFKAPPGASRIEIAARDADAAQANEPVAPATGEPR